MKRQVTAWIAMLVSVPAEVWNIVTLPEGTLPLARFLLAAALAVPCYLGGLWLPGPHPLIISALLGSTTMVAITRDGWLLLDGALALVFTVALPWTIGQYRRHQRAALRSAREHAAHVRSRERARIASDMHDTLGHDLTLIAVRVAALEVAPDLSSTHRAELRQVREGANAATHRLRDIIGLLREEPDAEPTTPLGETIAELVERTASSVATAGTVRLVDELPTDLPPVVERTAYRVVQESLTNATKYAPGAAITVSCTETATGVVVQVTNPAPVDGHPVASGIRGGYGLAGLTERLRLIGGTFTAEPLRDGGFQVVATMRRDPR